MQRKGDYVPRSDNKLPDFMRNLLPYTEEHHERWGLKDSPTELRALFEDYEAKLQKCISPNSGSVDKTAKNAAKEKLIRALRGYVQGFIARNTNVTEEDKKSMALPVYDVIPTPVSDPVGQAEAVITYPGRTQLMLKMQHVSGTPKDDRAYYGFRIYYGVADTNEPPPMATQLRESKFTRRKKELFTFTPADSGKTAHFCIRYENSKGMAGPWGPIFSAVIP